MGTSSKRPKPKSGQLAAKDANGAKSVGQPKASAEQPGAKANTNGTQPTARDNTNGTQTASKAAPGAAQADSKTTGSGAKATVIKTAAPVSTAKLPPVKGPPPRREQKRDARREEISRRIDERRQQREREQRNRVVKRGLYIGAPILLAVLVLGYIVYNVLFGPSVAAYLKGATIDGIPCDQGEQSQVHYHAHLEVYVNGSLVSVPGNVGRQSANGCFYWLHVHDDPGDEGVIHIEAPADQTYTLHQFFDIWGQPLSATNVLGHKVDATHKLTIYVFSPTQDEINQYNQAVQAANAAGQSPPPFKVTPPSDLKPYTGDPSQIKITPHEVIYIEYGTPTVQPTPWSFLSSE